MDEPYRCSCSAAVTVAFAVGDPLSFLDRELIDNLERLADAFAAAKAIDGDALCRANARQREIVQGLRERNALAKLFWDIERAGVADHIQSGDGTNVLDEARARLRAIREGS
jgi:hypothetical protein